MENSATSASSLSKPVRPNKAAVIVVFAAGIVIGLTPSALTFRSYLVLILAGVASIVIGAMKAGKKKVSSTETPGLGEFLLGGLSTISYTSLLSFSFLAPTFVAYIGSVALSLISGNLDLDNHILDINYSDLGWLFELLLSGIAVYVTYGTFDSIFEQLYPNAAGLKSAFYDLVHIGRHQLLKRIVLTVIALFVLILVAFLFFQGTITTWWFNLAYASILYFASVSFTKNKGVSFQPTDQQVLKALDKLFSAIGYNVILAPRTGRPDVDPLLIDLDLFAESADRTFAVKIFAQTKSDSPITLKTVSNLLPAKWALETYLKEDPEEIDRPVDLIVVIVENKFDAKLRGYCENEHIIFIESISQDIVRHILSIDDTAKLAEIATQHLGRVTEGGVIGDFVRPLPDHGGGS